MKKLMTMVAATMAFAAFADEPAAPVPEGDAPMAHAERLNRRKMRPPMMMGQNVMDPLFRAVMNPRVVEQIGLSDEQKAKLAEIRGEKQSYSELQAKVRAGTERQVKLLEAEKIDEAAVMQALDEVFEARKEIAKAQTKRVIALRSILTPEQAAKALEAVKSMGAGRHLRKEGPKGRCRSEMGPKCEGSECKVAPVE